MSEPRIALIAEGPTDFVIIEAALKAILVGRPFRLTLLQPEATAPRMGTGWCGVFKWCRDFATRGFPSLEQDPTLSGFDLFILHLDADVAEKRYSDGGSAMEEAAKDLLPLPCKRPCPPPATTVNEVRMRLLAWLDMKRVGSRTAICIPSKSTEAWLAAAVLPDGHPLLDGIECQAGPNPAAYPNELRIPKRRVEYLRRQPTLIARWDRISQLCTQARCFAADTRAALTGPVPP